ncbi:MAG: alcohol dehydrogenase catalytic domain-containing protein [Desulfobacterales bacterium]|nr:alcohol dehydrogenase catalytic domain-containing protein [Desulfobacterales bacterium]
MTSSTMRAVVFDHELRFVPDYPLRKIMPGWALIRVLTAGICKTDMELMKGYKEFHGILGHEFIGVIEQCDDAHNINKRVSGEINAGCGQCEWCANGLGRHCTNRRVLGILDLDGCMADYCMLPVNNLHEIPDSIPDHRAILIEPLSAACEILEQVKFKGSERVIVLGGGRLGILCAWVLTTVVTDVTLIGHHPEKLNLAKWRHLKTAHGADEVEAGADIVVEATGSGEGITEAMSLCRPRGTIVLKSTLASQGKLNLSPLVVNEQRLVGSRCGQFKDGFQMLESYPDMPLDRLITARYPIEKALKAFERAARPDALKVLLEVS